MPLSKTTARLFNAYGHGCEARCSYCRQNAYDAQTLILGDLNALSKPDYSSVEWRAHELNNKARGWGPPVDASEGCLALLRTAGFIDCFKMVSNHNDAWQQVPWTAHVSSDGPRYRIDYVMSRAPKQPTAKPQLVPREVHVEDGIRGSDHLPVVVDFEVVHI